MVAVHPKTERGEDRVAAVDDAVAIASVPRFVIFGEGEKSVPPRRRWLRREIAEQFRAIVDLPVTIAIQYEKRAARSEDPGNLDGMAVSANVKDYAREGRGETYATTGNVNDDGRNTADATAIDVDSAALLLT